MVQYKHYTLIRNVPILIMKKTFTMTLVACAAIFAIGSTVLIAGSRNANAQSYAQSYPYNCFSFTNDLQIGSTGPAVENLHILLAREGFNRSNSWSVSAQTYNEETASLVSGFQERYMSEILTPAGLRYGTGFVGARTRAKLNSMCAGGGTGTNSLAPVISNLSAPSTLQTNQTGTWSLTATDPQNSRITYYVSWGDESQLPYPVASATVPSTTGYNQQSTFTHAYAAPGTYTITFRARNNMGYEAQTTTTVYVTNGGGSTNADGLTFSVSPSKYSYAQGEAIAFTISARNTSGFEKVLNFNSGCQTSYRISGYDSATNQACTMMMTSVRIPAYGTQTWSVTHYPGTYNVPTGTYTLTGRVIGYGESTATITVGAGDYCAYGSYNCGNNSNTPRVISPNGGEWLQKGSYKQISWSYPNVQYFAAQPVDVNFILQGSNQYPYTYGAASQQGYSTCPVGSTCAYNPGQSSSYPYYPYDYSNQYSYGTKYNVLQNTTLNTYNWYVGSTPMGWSTMISGTYLMQVCLSGTTTCDVSDSTFTIY